MPRERAREHQCTGQAAPAFNADTPMHVTSHPIRFLAIMARSKQIALMDMRPRLLRVPFPVIRGDYSICLAMRINGHPLAFTAIRIRVQGLPRFVQLVARYGWFVVRAGQQSRLTYV